MSKSVVDLQPVTFLQSFFPVNLPKLLRTSFYRAPAETISDRTTQRMRDGANLDFSFETIFHNKGTTGAIGNYKRKLLK